MMADQHWCRASKAAAKPKVKSRAGTKDPHHNKCPPSTPTVNWHKNHGSVTREEITREFCTSLVFAACQAMHNWHPPAHHHRSVRCSQSRQVYTTTTTTTTNTQIFAVHTSQALCASKILFTLCLERKEPASNIWFNPT